MLLLFSFILFILIYIVFSNYCLKQYSLNDPRLDDYEIENINKELVKYQFVLYNILAIIFIITVCFFDINMAIISSIIILLSIICRIVNYKKITNILYIIFLFSIFFFLLGKILLGTNENDLPITDTMSEVETAAFNSKFTQYEGSNITGAQVKALINQVVSSNSNDENESRQVIITGPYGFKVEGSQIDNDNPIKNSYRYKIEVTEYDDNGLVKIITITEVNKDIKNQNYLKTNEMQ